MTFQYVLMVMSNGSDLVKFIFNPLSANPTKWSNTLKQFVAKLPTNFLSVFDHFVKLAFKGLTLFRTVFRRLSKI